MKKTLPPALESLRNRPDVTFLELTLEDTQQVVTHGFTDDQIRGMNRAALDKQISDINRQEKVLYEQLADLAKRRQAALDITQRKSEIERDGLRN